MNKKFVTLGYLIFLLITFGCNETSIVGDQDIIKTLRKENAAVKKIDSTFFLYFKDGIKVDSPNLLDTIYLLLPSNLPQNYELDGLSVITSGNILENPGYSSHNNYTSFYITEITKR